MRTLALPLWLQLLQIPLSTAEYVWPSPGDELEDLLSLQSGYIKRGFTDGILSCAFGQNVKGRQNAAEWIRTAFHDAITHDTAAGTGGLDSSIAFELDRAENVGAAFKNTFGFTVGFYSTRASSADLLALAVVSATAMCMGPKIPFRYGRVDAAESGPLGVPEPSTDLQATRDAFARAGYSEEDMIAMVACGHTVGGVHSVDFLELVPGGSTDPANDTVAHFDGTFDGFDPAVVTEYLDGTTANPLVVAANETLRSDLRVFAADGNKTVSALADKAKFMSMCAAAFEKIIDTVPAAVTLSEPVDATDIKPYILSKALNGDGNIALSGRVRVRTSPGSGKSSGDLAVQLSYSSRDGTPAARNITTKRPTLRGGTSAGLFGETFDWFEFTDVVPADTGISKALIHVTTPSTGAVVSYDNGGTGGYPIGDVLLYQDAQSCLNVTIVDGYMALTVTAQVREDAASNASLFLDLVTRVARPGIVVPALEVGSVAFTPTGRTTGGYVEYRAQTKVLSSSWSTTFDVRLEGEQPGRVEFQRTNVLTSNKCV